MPGELLFKTKRLGCRRWVRDDLEDIYLVYSDKEGARWVGDGLPITHEECERWVETTLENYEKRGYGMFAILELPREEIVGFGGLVHPGGQPEVEIKYALHKASWGKGFASEFVAGLLSYAATELRIDKVIATVAEENKASQRVLEKSSLNFVRRLKEEDGSITRVYEKLLQSSV